jgi:hypothetical protein
MRTGRRFAKAADNRPIGTRGLPAGDPLADDRRDEGLEDCECAALAEPGKAPDQIADQTMGRTKVAMVVVETDEITGVI